MTEFHDVCKQWRRMCKAFEGDCDKCPIEGSPCQYIAFQPNDLKYIEKPIMEWAAANPEPVYPTWWEWLYSIGVVTRKVKPDAASALVDTGILDHIPADIAEKLGIVPKEG